MFCCTLLYVHSSIAIILMGKRELIALLNLSSLCFVMVERLFLAVPQGCLQFVIVVFPDHTHLLFLELCPGQEVIKMSCSTQLEFSLTLLINPRHREEEPQNTNSNNTSESKAASFLIHIKMIANQERTLSIAL